MKPGPLEISVKRSAFRPQDEDGEIDEEQYRAIRLPVFRRDKYTCRYCGSSTVPTQGEWHGSLLASGYFEVHHIDDDHSNNDPGNLATVCPFCHSVFHVGNAGARKSAMMIWMPSASQERINGVMMGVFVALYRRESGEMADRHAGTLAEGLYYGLRACSGLIEQIFCEGASDPLVFGKGLGALSGKHYEQRNAILAGARILPEYEYYKTRHVPYWDSRVYGALPCETWEDLCQDASTDA